MSQHLILRAAVYALQQHGVIAYPTEAVYGLGCDPKNTQAIQRILEIKHRNVQKGLILVAANWQQLYPWLQPLSAQEIKTIQPTWPGHTTWVLPAKHSVSSLLTGKYHTLAVRISAHPVVRQLCELYGSALVSTSANYAGQSPLREYRQVKNNFSQQLDYIIAAKVGNAREPSCIRMLNGNILRT